MGNEMQTYIFAGWAKGRFDAEDPETKQVYKKDYFNIYLISPVSSYKSDDYEALGYKAEKYSCIGPHVWENVIPGEEVNVFFAEKQKVAMLASLGNVHDLSVG